MKIGLAQIECKSGDIISNLNKIKGFISRARKEKVNLLVFPELSLTGYSIKSPVSEVAIRIDNPIIEDLKKESEDISLVVGFVEESKDYNFYNSALYLEEGKIKYLHRKIYLPTYGLFEEKKYFVSGKIMRAFETSYGPMAILICADSWHPILPYISALDGASIFIYPAASFEKSLGEEISIRSAWERLNKFYAQIFSSYVVFVNRVGSEEENRFWGGSTVTAPGGEEIARADYYTEYLATAVIDLNQVRHYKTILPEFKEEKIDLAIRELKRLKEKRSKFPPFDAAT
ncbi:MAG: nitrilase-related carbon-nitrogen hydrolase [Candidatus Aerophobetes bacterium]|nr:nitrilase-related carbon-nitrogen hydrolase [Candidatus Aerophobetes bacterium]